MFAMRRTTATAAVAGVVALAAAACTGDSDGSASPSSSTTAKEPAVTAPPTLSPEEQAEAEIQATFEQVIAAWDDFKANASDYADDAMADPAWNFALVESEMRMLDEAQVEFLNSTNAFLGSEVEQVGHTAVLTNDISDVVFREDGSASAIGDACLDMSGLSFVSYDGQPADLPSEPSVYQRWATEFGYVPGRAGWFVTRAEVEVLEACS